jgi:ketosteroid isomerase-like protein
LAGFLPLFVSRRRVPTEREQQNIRIVQDLYAAFGRADIAHVHAMLTADVEWREPENPFNPSAGVRRGHAGFLEWARVGHDAEEITALEPRHFLANEDIVAVVGYTKCRVRSTGRSYETDFVHLITLRGSKVARFQEFFDTYAAGEAFRSSTDDRERPPDCRERSRDGC